MPQFSTPLVIEMAAVTDYVEITELWEASVRATHHFLPESDILYFKPLILNEYLKAVHLECIRSTDGAIMGFMGVHGDGLEMLFIHPDARGQGLGSFFVQHAIHELGVTRVDVNEQNPQAVGFYQKMGFQIINRSETDGLGKPYPILHLKLS